ncbi:uncharacterized protein LOC133203609 isoform X2 [Saccostrea echinata]|uniref:uncharacterized protein LOC133203609 isoform X2 n=1 Tax=Saccostrea echinata TaxID=191078 RepID=UPI002A838205|nr:uncharacterized protein LOC133203609 isoform X2 [Saccostrea echinata]
MRSIFHLLMYAMLVLQTVLRTRAFETRYYIIHDEHKCNVEVCGAQTDYVGVDERIVIFGGSYAMHSSIIHKHDDCSKGQVCELQLFPDSSNHKEQQLHLIFKSLYITSDKIQIKLDQASTTSFKDVQPIAILTKNSSRPKDFMTDVGNVLRIRLSEGNSSDGYGFEISITRAGASLTPPPPSSSDSPVSPGVIALVVFIAVAVVSFIVFLVVKTIILRKRMKFFQRNSRESLTGITPRDGCPENRRRAEANTYTPIPREGGDDSHPGTQRQRSEDSSYVMTDFPYVNTPIVVVKSSDSSQPTPSAPPPDYDEAVRMPYEMKD